MNEKHVWLAERKPKGYEEGRKSPANEKVVCRAEKCRIDTTKAETNEKRINENERPGAQHRPLRSARRQSAGLTHEAMPPGGLGPL